MLTGVGMVSRFMAMYFICVIVRMEWVLPALSNTIPVIYCQINQTEGGVAGCLSAFDTLPLDLFSTDSSRISVITMQHLVYVARR
jgi:hypothetical protein